jgi:hypothetical protein
LADAFFEQQANERFEFANAVIHLFKVGRFGFAASRDAAMIEDTQTFATRFDDFAGNADDGSAGRHGMNDDGTGANFDIIAEFNVAENGSAGADDNAVANGGVTFAAYVASAAEGHALVKQNIVADFGGFADDDAEPMIDEKALADFGARVDFDAG